jgi:acetyl esterase/lipase
VRYPVPLEDVHAAWGWFADVTKDLGADPRQLAIGGASAGANLAAAATMRIRDESGALPTAMHLAYTGSPFPGTALSDQLGAEMRQLPRMLRFTPADIIDLTRWYTRPTDRHPNSDNARPRQSGRHATHPDRALANTTTYAAPVNCSTAATRGGCARDSTVAVGILHGHLNLTRRFKCLKSSGP